MDEKLVDGDPEPSGQDNLQGLLALFGSFRIDPSEAVGNAVDVGVDTDGVNGKPQAQCEACCFGSHPVESHEGRSFIRNKAAVVSNEDAAYQSEFLCHSSEIAQRLRRPLKWDAKKEAFIDDVEANRLMDKPYRGPWKI